MNEIKCYYVNHLFFYDSIKLIEGLLSFLSGHLLFHCRYFNYVIFYFLLAVVIILNEYGEDMAENDDYIYLSMVTLENGMWPIIILSRNVINFSCMRCW